MDRFIAVAAALMLLSLSVASTNAGTSTAAAAGQDPKGKTCRMEQQCRWENFKKICTWVKVCR